MVAPDTLSLMTHTVKILETVPVAPDGRRVVWYRRGAICDVSDGVLKMLINLGACELVQNKAITSVAETKGKKRRAK